MLMQSRFSVLVAVALFALVLACDRELFIQDTPHLYLNGEQQQSGSKRLRELVLSNFGMTHHGKKAVVFDIFQRPRANILILVDESSTDSCAAGTTPRPVHRIINTFWKRFHSMDKQPFMFSVAEQESSAKAPFQSLPRDASNIRIVSQDKNNNYVLQSTQQVLLAAQQSTESAVDSEFTQLSRLLPELMRLKSNTGAPDFFVVTISSLKASSANHQETRARVMNTLIPQLLKAFSSQYNGNTMGQVVTMIDRPAVQHHAGRRKLMMASSLSSSSPVPVVPSLLQANALYPNISKNVTAFDLEVAEYQATIWVWFILIVCLIFGFGVTHGIDYSADCLNYATSADGMSSSSATSTTIVDATQ